MSTVLTVRKEFTVDGAYKDPTSIVLSDKSGAYGIRKTGGANVIAAGTALTKVSTGVYTFAFTEAVGAEYDQAYTSYVKIVYDGLTNYFDEDHAAVDSVDAILYGDDFPTNLATARLQVSQRLVWVTGNPKPSYAVRGQSVQWSAYVNMLTETLKRLNDLIAMGEVDAEPYEVHSQALF